MFRVSLWSGAMAAPKVALLLPHRVWVTSTSALTTLVTRTGCQVQCSKCPLSFLMSHLMLVPDRLRVCA